MSQKRKVTGTAVYGTVCTVVGEDGGREPSSYPIKGDQQTRGSYYDIVTQNALVLFKSQMQGAGVSFITR